MNAESGEVHIVGAGGTIIQATASETADYNAKTVKYYLSVQLRTQTEFKIDLDKLGIDVPVGAIGAPEINVPVGTDDFTIPVSGQAEGSIVQFTSNNPNVATVDANGRVHIVGKGTAGIAVTATRTAIYENKTIAIYINVTSSGSTSGSGGGIIVGGIGGSGGGVGGSGYTGNVTEAGSASPRELLPQVDFSFHAGSPKILKSVGAPDFAITASGQVVDSKITYASSDPSVATVDVNTGTVHVVRSGNVTITATASETTLHRAETCAYELEVQ